MNNLNSIHHIKMYHYCSNCHSHIETHWDMNDNLTGSFMPSTQKWSELFNKWINDFRFIICKKCLINKNSYETC
jgi:hypothetical protein